MKELKKIRCKAKEPRILFGLTLVKISVELLYHLNFHLILKFSVAL